MQNAMSPVEYDMVQSVFDSLAQAEWFDRSESNEQACAKLVLLVHCTGIDDAATLHRACEPQARRRFSKHLANKGVLSKLGGPARQ
jgi:hypothetical protein